MERNDDLACVLNLGSDASETAWVDAISQFNANNNEGKDFLIASYQNITVIGSVMALCR